MNVIPRCPSVGKMYIIFFHSVMFSFIFTTTNVIKYKESKSDKFKIPSIFFNVLAFLIMLYIIKIDIFNMYGDNEKCKKDFNCNWLIYDKKCNKIFNHNNILLFLLMACSLYLLIFGTHELKYFKDENYKNEDDIYTNLTYLTIASVIFGSTCLIFIFSDILTLIHLFS